MKIIYLALLLLGISACSSLPDVIEPVQDDAKTGSHKIYVVSHGWHTGIITPALLMQRRIPGLKKRFKHTRYLEFGWGDKAFYQAETVTLGLALQAILWPTDSVVHVSAVPMNPADYYPGARMEEICLNDGNYSRLLKFLDNSFAKNDKGNVISLEKGLQRDSHFYQGVGDYYLTNTCNKWTAKALKSAGMEFFLFNKLISRRVMDVVVEAKRDNPGYRCKTAR